MGAAKKSFVLVLAFILYVCALGPMPHTFAEARIYQVKINTGTPYLIAGQSYSVSFSTDKASSTFMDVNIDYSVDNGLTWRLLTFSESEISRITLPIDPQLTSTIFRVSAYFSPLIGSDSYSEQKMGPYQILQPGSISDVTATPNTDGTVTLAWTDNSNMESYYQIIRDGPDGSKIFYVNHTTDHIGPLSYVDKKTDIFTSTIYAYSVLPVIDQYNLPDNNKPGVVSVLAKTKEQLNLTNIIIGGKPNPNTNGLTDKVRMDNELKFTTQWGKYIPDIDKVAVSSVTLNKKAITLQKGDNEALTAAVIPSNAANQKVTWSSDNIDVADVDSAGTVTGISPGTAKITVQAENGGFKAVCVAIVTEISENKEPETDTPRIQLTDIAEHRANSDITKAVKLGFVSGYPDNTFRPDAGVTRAEFASMLMKGLKPMVEGIPLTFDDKMDIQDWAVQSVEQAVELGIISGYADGTFRPNANITHAEMITMVVRASGLSTDNALPTGYADDESIPKWAKASVSTAEKNGIIIVSGITDNEFAPQVLSTRSEAASAIVRMLIVKK